MSYFRKQIFNESWENQLNKELDLVKELKKRKQDPSIEAQSIYTRTLSQRIGALFKDSQLVKLVESCLTEKDRLALVKNLIEKLIVYYDMPNEQKIEKILKVVLAILTEGVVTAPIDGLPSVEVMDDKSIRLEVAGPIRAVGGTVMGMMIVIAEYLRQKFNFNVYKPTPEEIKRGVAQIMAYLRTHPPQIRPSKEQISFVIEKCPIMIDGRQTGKETVPLYKYLPRIQKPRIRGGIPLVIVEGLIIRASKVLNFSQGLQLKGLQWINQLIEIGKQYRKDTSQRNTTVASKYALSIGRPVLSNDGSTTGLRLRFGSTPTTGLSACNLHPLVLDLLGFANIGSQLVVSYPGKGATISGTCEDLEKPLVRYKDGVRFYEPGTRDQVLQIVQLGEILFGLGQCIEFQKKLKVRDYCRGLWRRDTLYQVDIESLDEEQALNLHKTYPQAKLAPKFALNLQNLTFGEYVYLKQVYDHQTSTYVNEPKTIDLLCKMGVSFQQTPHNLKITYSKIFSHYLHPLFKPNLEDYLQATANGKGRSRLTLYLNKFLKANGFITVPEKGFLVIYARIGRAQAVHLAKLKPHACNSLAQLKKKSIESFWTYVEKHPTANSIFKLRLCTRCNKEGIYRQCIYCQSPTQRKTYCKTCNSYIEEKDVNLHKDHFLRSQISVKRNYLRQIEFLKQKGLKTYPLNWVKKQAPLKLHNSANVVKYPEPLIKGYLRAKNQLSVTKDGTIRISHPNLPTTHFVPSQCNTSLQFLRSIGYTTDYKGLPLESPNQILCLRPEDIIVGKDVARYALKIYRFLDQLIKIYYEWNASIYEFNSLEDLLGTSFFSISPHTSVASINRIIGFTENKGIYYHPTVIASRRRDADGDMDSGGPAMDLFLNMSPQFLDQSKTGALMGVPLSYCTSYQLDNIGKEVLNRQVDQTYYENLNLDNLRQYDPKELSSIKRVSGYLEKGILIPEPSQYRFNTPGFSMNTGHTKNFYLDADNNQVKVDLTLDLEKKLKGVSQEECILGLIEGHLIPDLIGNSNAYFRQKLLCDNCKAQYAITPLSKKCVQCRTGTLKQTVYPGMVLKYFDLLIQLESQCELPAYLVDKVTQLKETLKIFQGDMMKKNKLRQLF